MTSAPLGTIGAKLDLQVRQGADLGPFVFQMRQSDGTPVSMAGSTVTGRMKPLGRPGGVVDLQFTVSTQVVGQFTMDRVPGDVTMTYSAGSSVASQTSLYAWECEEVRADGSIRPLYYGVLSVMRSAKNA